MRRLSRSNRWQVIRQPPAPSLTDMRPDAAKTLVRCKSHTPPNRNTGYSDCPAYGCIRCHRQGKPNRVVCWRPIRQLIRRRNERPGTTPRGGEEKHMLFGSHLRALLCPGYHRGTTRRARSPVVPHWHAHCAGTVPLEAGSDRAVLRIAAERPGLLEQRIESVQLVRFGRSHRQTRLENHQLDANARFRRLPVSQHKSRKLHLAQSFAGGRACLRRLEHRPGTCADSLRPWR